MSTKLRLFLVAGLVAMFGLAGGSAFADDHLPINAPEDCVENVMDLPALNVCKDAAGRHILDLPTMELREPTPVHHDKGHGHAGKGLPKTGLHTEDFAAIGMAALAGGAVLLRRLRLAVS